MSSSKSIQKLEEHIKRVEETENSWIIEFSKSDDVDEISTSAGAGAYDSKYAFGELDDDDVEKAGYTRVPESKFKKLAKTMYLSELNYREYKRDDSMNSKKKVNMAIKEINSKIYEIERIVNQNLKLKSETGVDSNSYWKSSRARLKKISERMFNLVEKIRKF